MKSRRGKIPTVASRLRISDLYTNTGDFKFQTSDTFCALSLVIKQIRLRAVSLSTLSSSSVWLKSNPAGGKWPRTYRFCADVQISALSGERGTARSIRANRSLFRVVHTRGIIFRDWLQGAVAGTIYLCCELTERFSQRLKFVRCECSQKLNLFEFVGRFSRNIRLLKRSQSVIPNKTKNKTTVNESQPGYVAVTCFSKC